MIDIETMKYVIEDQFESLCKQYNITNCELLICNWNEWLNDRYNKRYRKIARGSKQLIECINYDSTLYISSFAHYFYDVIDEEAGTVLHTIYVPVENLKNVCLHAYIFNPGLKAKITGQDIIDYLKFVIKHEIGHIIHINKTFAKKGVNDGIIYLNNKQDTDLERYYKYMSKIDETADTEYEFYYNSFKKYNSLYCEREANKAVGLSVEEMIPLNIKMEAGLENISEEV